LSPVSKRFYQIDKFLQNRKERKIRVILENESEANEATITQNNVQAGNFSQELQKTKIGACSTRASFVATCRQIQTQRSSSK
jgi:hypothetical protein